MSAKTARTHNHVSNRAKPREAGERKVVFKSVLDNPFRIQWPSVSMNIQNSVLALTIAKMDGVSEHNHNRAKDRRKRKREHHRSLPNKKRRKSEDEDTVDPSIITVPNETQPDPPSSAPLSLPKDGRTSLEQPTVLQHIAVGINEVTRRLESQIQESRRTVVTTAEHLKSKPPRPRLKVILVCRADIDPPLLIDHLPHLVAAHNSTQTLDIVKLVPLPKGAESSLAQAIGLRRAAVVGIDAAFPDLASLVALLDTVPTLVATWLAPRAIPQHQLVPTHIKQVRTSAPKDMRAAKEQRVKEKALAKQRRKDARQSLQRSKT